MDSEIGLLIITIIGWGLWGFFQKIGISRLGADSCLLLNGFTVISVIVVYLAFTNRLQIMRSRSVIYPILGGVSAAVGSIAFFAALKTTPVSIARSIAGLCVIITAFLGVFLLGETLTLKQIVGIGFAIASIILISS